MLNDLRYALRMLTKSPGFSMIAIVTLALGIGANSAIFSVVDAVLLRPLPFKNPEQLMMVWGYLPREHELHQSQSYPDYADFRDQNKTFVSMAAYTRAATVLIGAGESQLLEGLAVGPEIFDTIGISPFLGRAYTRAEDKPNVPRVVVLTYGLWQRAFGADPNVIGRQVNMAYRSYTVVGVLPREWKFPVDGTQINYLTPLQTLVPEEVPKRDSHFLTIVGRLKPDVDVRQAQSELGAIAAHLEQQYPDSDAGHSVRVVSLYEEIVGSSRPALAVLLGAVALVLLIACANVANLLLARATARSHEITIRVALGASRFRVVRQLLAESFLLAFVGGTGGLLLAWWGIDLLASFGPNDLPRMDEIAINPSVCIFTFTLAILSTIVFGLVPALQISRPHVSESLHGSKGSTGNLQSHRLRGALIVSQVALSLLLLAGAGLLIKSFYNLRNASPGFDPSRVLMMNFVLPGVKYPKEDQQIRFFDAFLSKLATLPGLQSVGGVNPLPFSNNSRGSTFAIAGQPPTPRGNHPAASHLIVNPGYFRTMGIPLLAGRAFDQRESAASSKVIMINEAFARKFLPNKNPLGEKVIIDRDDPNPPGCEVIGMVGNSKHDSLREESTPEFYTPFPQEPQRRVFVVLRTSASSLSGLDTAVRRLIQESDKDIFIPKLQPMESLLSAQLAQPRFNMILLAAFAGVAMTLAAIGIYGVIGYGVAQRTREIGIRMALGAQRGDMLRMILQQSMTLVIVGLLIGLIASFAGTRLLSSLLYGVGANDLFTYLSVVFLLGSAALVASYVPARRAMKINPMVALRYE